MRWSWIIPKSRDKCPYQTQMHRGEATWTRRQTEGRSSWMGQEGPWPRAWPERLLCPPLAAPGH